MRPVECLHPAGRYLPVVVVVEDVVLPVPDGAMVELPGVVELVVVEELDGLVLVVLSVVVVEDDGGMAGVVVDVVVLEFGGVITVVLGVELGGATTVVSLRSQPTTPIAMAMAKVLDNRILDFMGKLLST
ncbi:MAG: hypothetical protein ABJC33_08075, partial [Betaproteobacteria bacterium]